MEIRLIHSEDDYKAALSGRPCESPATRMNARNIRK
jgi:hypothetical protein